MSDKNLTELEWKKFSKGKDFKDSAFIKALSGLERAKSPDQELAALADVDKQADGLRKAHKADKDLVGYLDDLDKALDKRRRAAEAEAKRAAQQAQDADDEEESPALLTTKLVPLLRQVRKGEPMQAMLASNGKQVAVLLSRRAISPSRRKLLADYLGGGTAKYFGGECQFEENAYTFVLRTQAAGMAKKLRAGLLEQTGLRMKVRVRGEDPNDIDEDGEAEDEGGQEGAASPAQAAAAPAAAAAAGDAARTAAAAEADDGQKARFEERMAAVQPEVLALLRAGAADASKIRAVAEFARGKGDAGQYKPALAALDNLDKLLEAARGAPPAPPREPAPAAAGQPQAAPAEAGAGAEEAAAFNARLAALMPQVKTALAAGGAAAEAVKLKVSQAGLEARNKDFAAAGRLLDEAEAAMRAPAAAADADASTNAAPPAAAEPPPGAANAQEAVARRMAQLEPRYAELLAGNPADASRLRAVFGYASEQNEAGQAAKAAAALDQLERLMEAAERAREEGADDGGEQGYEGLVAYRKTLQEFRIAAQRVDGQIQALKTALPEQMPDERDLADELAQTLEDYNAELLDLVDEAMNLAEDKATSATRALASRIDAYIDDLASDPLISQIDDNPLGVRVSIRDTLGGALRNIREALPELA